VTRVATAGPKMWHSRCGLSEPVHGYFLFEMLNELLGLHTVDGRD
jgi:hypothetical protein